MQVQSSEYRVSESTCDALQLFFKASTELEAFMFEAASKELVEALVNSEPGPAAEDALFGLFAEYVVHNYSAELQSYRCNLLDHPPLVC